MTQKAKDKRNEYMKKWREKNKERVKAAQVRYWERQARAEGERSHAKS